MKPAARRASARAGRPPKPVGSVSLVGAGPGDPALITVRGLALIRSADVIVRDRLAPPELLEFARRGAKYVYAGKGAGGHTMTQAQINRLLVRLARQGKSVVRLKGGDPFVFGRGGEEAEALAAAGIPFEVVPGVTSAIAGPAAAGIPVTHRDWAASVAIATAHEAPGKAGSRLDWEALARADTIVLLMGVERLAEAARALIAAGKRPSTPAAVVCAATTARQRTVVAPLSRIARTAERARIVPPAVTVVGDVVRLREVIGGYDTRPLTGVRVLVTRTRTQASELSAVLRELGATVLEAPAIATVPPRSAEPMRRAVRALAEERYGWLVLTSANGVRALTEALRRARRDARAVRAKVAAIGPGTAEALARVGIVPDLIPPTFTTEAVGAAFPRARGRGRVLLMRADQAERRLDAALREKGWTVERVVAYRIVDAAKVRPRLKPAMEGVRRRVLEGEVDVLTFASGGTVRAFKRWLRGTPARRAKVVCIGPVTAEAARAAGLRVTAVAREHTIPGLVAATLEAVRGRH